MERGIKSQPFHFNFNYIIFDLTYAKESKTLFVPNLERAIRSFAIGRNNWMFSDSESGAHASGLFYSLVVTAKANRVNPYEALKRIFTDIPEAKTVEDYEKLADFVLAEANL